ncbi:RecX family transcriptional regulator [Sandaracinobacter sp. RS1-74]|uniref:regulatory protein RecX n=1 Tax=Sandaracinobacteroides sayramensis TaxID=2913411 RepID=UPI001EDC0081|nr:regulatory protein RecX [Sandaracinobacteroides sayramensis]MCG2839996.1 RecX family transcriptional regulator [Sandaracinobacteroides sayramensis]
MASKTRERRERKPAAPLDAGALQAVAVRYVERFQTSRARLIRLLEQKLRQRGWEEGGAPPDLDAIADRMVELGYVNDALFAESRARGLSRRGLGQARVRQTLAANGIDGDVQASALEQVDALEAALLFARRKRLGPFGPPPEDRSAEEKQLAAMARAGHPSVLARAIVRARSEDELPNAFD